MCVASDGLQATLLLSPRWWEPACTRSHVGVHHSIISRSAQSSPVNASPGGISASHTGVSAPWASVFTPLCWVMSGQQKQKVSGMGTDTQPQEAGMGEASQKARAGSNVISVMTLPVST